MEKIKEVILSIRYNWRPTPNGGEKYNFISIEMEGVKRILLRENELGQCSYIVEFDNGNKKELFNPNEIEYVLQKEFEIYTISVKNMLQFGASWYADASIGFNEFQAVLNDCGDFEIINHEEHTGKTIHRLDCKIINQRTVINLIK